MLERLKTFIEEATGVEAFDPSRFNDPLALQVEWTPRKSGGANFRTHKLVQVDFNRIEFRATLVAKFFYSIFLLVGVGLAGGVTVESARYGVAFFRSDIRVPSASVREGR